MLIVQTKYVSYTTLRISPPSQCLSLALSKGTMGDSGEPFHPFVRLIRPCAPLPPPLLKASATYLVTNLIFGLSTHHGAAPALLDDVDIC